MSLKNISYVKDHNPELDEGKLHLLLNWKDVDKYVKPDQVLKKEYGLINKFIAIYGGNFGKPQQLEFILDLAARIRYLDDVIFLFIGNGTEKQKIIERVERDRLLNVRIMNILPRNKYQELVRLCDIGLVNLSNRFTIPNIPSRTLSYWEAKIPILAAIDENTDFGTLLEQSGSGLSSISGDLDSYIKNFEKLYFDKNLRAKMGTNGYNYLIENCTTKQAFKIISDKILSSVQ